MGAPLFPQHVIARKRDGKELDRAEIEDFVRGAVDGSWADYQLSALLMAVFIRGMTPKETAVLTEAVMHSGIIADLSAIRLPKADKHSTGGVGDKVSLHLAPMVAACGIAVPMISGRGLGHTGGTVDKLESIPGFRVGLSLSEFRAQVGKIGVALISQTDELVPADRKLYALRDVTATVECIPLIVASILSKKLAEGIDALVLDVKVGRGAFMKDEARARELAAHLVRVGTRAGKKVVALLTSMDAPLGVEVGNASETREAIDVLRGGGPDDLVECTMALGAEMVVLGSRAATLTEARARLAQAVASGAGARVFERMIEAQGGDPRVVSEPARLVIAPTTVPVKALRSGVVEAVDALAIGLAGVAMGAGRARADAAIDPAVGISVDAKPGRPVRAGDVLARVHVQRASDADGVAERVAGAFRIGEAAPASVPLVRGRLGA
jgi:pyrimidine-nucleoside phosphorylase